MAGGAGATHALWQSQRRLLAESPHMSESHLSELADRQFLVTRQLLRPVTR
jgi:hypothetical protein